ncbi:MAG: amidase family protein, partial [Geminicoccaceae bacterium]|nr:amidase family protein [Geminicoccaceae bacterium]
IPAVAYLEALAVRGRILEDFVERVFRRCDAVMAPVATGPAPLIEATAGRTVEELAARIMPLTHATRPINYLGLPSLAVPCGRVDGLPVAFQLIGRPFAEALLFNLGHAYEKASGWRDVAPPVG